MAYPINPPAMSFMARKLVPVSRTRRTDVKNYTATYEPKTMAGERGWSRALRHT